MMHERKNGRLLNILIVFLFLFLFVEEKHFYDLKTSSVWNEKKWKIRMLMFDKDLSEKMDLIGEI